MPISVNHIVDALSSLGGEAQIGDILERVLQIAPKPIPPSARQIIRARIQERASETESYKPGLPDLFVSAHGIEARKGVWRLRNIDILNTNNPDSVQDGVETYIAKDEGRSRLRIHLRRERSQKLIIAFKNQLSDFSCVVCGFDFEKTYGKIGAKFIEAHHKIPVASLGEGDETKVSDLAAVCSNCHRMIHRNDLLSVDQLREQLLSKRTQSKAGVVERSSGNINYKLKVEPDKGML